MSIMAMTLTIGGAAPAICAARSRISRAFSRRAAKSVAAGWGHAAVAASARARRTRMPYSKRYLTAKLGRSGGALARRRGNAGLASERIFNAHQEQPFRRSGRSALARRLQERAQLCAADVALARLQQRAHHIPHHVLEKAAAAHAINEAALRRFELRGKHRPDFRSAFGIALVGGRERREI